MKPMSERTGSDILIASCSVGVHGRPHRRPLRVRVARPERTVARVVFATALPPSRCFAVSATAVSSDHEESLDSLVVVVSQVPELRVRAVALRA